MANEHALLVVPENVPDIAWLLLASIAAHYVPHRRHLITAISHTPYMLPAQVAEGVWEPCQGAANASEVTLLPSGYANQTASDPAAAAAANSSREPMIAAHGTVCQLPLLYNGVQVGAGWTPGCVHCREQQQQTADGSSHLTRSPNCSTAFKFNLRPSSIVPDLHSPPCSCCSNPL